MIDDDVDAPEDFEKEPVEKPSLREVWENNPALKLVAIVAGGAVLLGRLSDLLFQERRDGQIDDARAGCRDGKAGAGEGRG